MALLSSATKRQHTPTRLSSPVPLACSPIAPPHSIPEAPKTPAPQRARLDSYEHQIDQLVQQKAIVERAHKAEVGRLQGQLTLKEGELRVLRRERDGFREKVQNGVGKDEIQRIVQEGEEMRANLILDQKILYEQALLSIKTEQLVVLDLKESLRQAKVALEYRDAKLAQFQARESTLEEEVKDGQYYKAQAFSQVQLLEKQNSLLQKSATASLERDQRLQAINEREKDILSQENETLLRKLEKMSKRLEGRSAEVAGETEELEATVQTLRSTLSKTEAKNTALIKEVDDLRAAVKKLERQADKSKSALTSWASNGQEVEEAWEEKEKAWEAKEAKLKAKIANQREIQADLQSQMDEAQILLKAQKKTLKVKATEASDEPVAKVSKKMKAVNHLSGDDGTPSPVKIKKAKAVVAAPNASKKRPAEDSDVEAAAGNDSDIPTPRQQVLKKARPKPKPKVFTAPITEPDEVESEIEAELRGLEDDGLDEVEAPAPAVKKKIALGKSSASSSSKSKPLEENNVVQKAWAASTTAVLKKKASSSSSSSSFSAPIPPSRGGEEAPAVEKQKKKKIKLGGAGGGAGVKSGFVWNPLENTGDIPSILSPIKAGPPAAIKSSLLSKPTGGAGLFGGWAA